MNALSLATRGYLSTPDRVVVGPAPVIIGAAPESPVVGGAKLEVVAGPAIIGSRKLD